MDDTGGTTDRGARRPEGFAPHAARARRVVAGFQTRAGSGNPAERVLWLFAALLGFLLVLVLLAPLLILGIAFALGFALYAGVRRALASGRPAGGLRGDGRRNVRVIPRDDP